MTEQDDHFVVGSVTPEQRAFLNEVMELGLDFVAGRTRDDLVLRHATNDELKQVFSEALPREGSGLKDLLCVLKDTVVRYSIAQSDPRFLAFPDCGNSLATYAADILASFLNQNLIAVDRSAPAGTFVEIQLLLWLRELIGYPTVALRDLPNMASLGGMWTPGGNMSNHIAVLVALQRRFPHIAKTGLFGLKRRPVMVLARGIEQFSFAGAARALGLGSEGILWARSNPNYTTDVESVKAALDNARADVEPFMVVCVAGNCRTTGIDEIAQMRDLCDQRGLWLHVDACHGGCLLLSEEHRSRLKGIETANSVSLDPHKGFFVTYPASYVLFRDPHALGALSRYPEQTQDAECMDTGLITPFFGSRGFQSLKLWLLIKHLGLKELGCAVDRRQQLNARLSRELEATGLFTCLHDNEFYRQAFVFCPKQILAAIPGQVRAGKDPRLLRKIISHNTRLLAEQLYKSGRVVFDLFSLQDLDNVLGLGNGDKYSVMGMAAGQPEISEPMMVQIRQAIIECGEPLQENMAVEILRGHDISPAAAPLRVDSPAGW